MKTINVEHVILDGLTMIDIENNPFVNDNSESVYDEEIQKYIFANYADEVIEALRDYEGSNFEDDVLTPIFEKHYTPALYKIVEQVPAKWDDEEEGK